MAHAECVDGATVADDCERVGSAVSNQRTAQSSDCTGRYVAFDCGRRRFRAVAAHANTRANAFGTHRRRLGVVCQNRCSLCIDCSCQFNDVVLRLSYSKSSKAFEITQKRRAIAANLTRQQLLQRWKEDNDPRPAHMSFAWAAQGATDFDRWATSSEPYKVRYMSHFEPYYVVPKDSERYDQRFRGYGAGLSCDLKRNFVLTNRRQSGTLLCSMAIA